MGGEHTSANEKMGVLAFCLPVFPEEKISRGIYVENKTGSPKGNNLKIPESPYSQ